MRQRELRCPGIFQKQFMLIHLHYPLLLFKKREEGQQIVQPSDKAIRKSRKNIKEEGVSTGGGRRL